LGTLQSNPIIQSEKPTQNIESKPAFTSDNHSYEVFRFFSVDPFANKDPYVFKQINEISNWAKDGSKDMGDALWKIRKMENKLGIPANGETRYTKMYNYIKMAKITQSLEKERNMQLEIAKAQRQSQIDKIRREKEQELKELEKQRNKELKQLNRQHSNILKPLYKIRSAFERGV
jgi:hypothetical protein